MEDLWETYWWEPWKFVLFLSLGIFRKVLATEISKSSYKIQQKRTVIKMGVDNIELIRLSADELNFKAP